MDVKDFIADTLIQIIAGVKQAQDYAVQNGAIVNAGLDNRDPSSREPTQQVDFDIFITTSDSTKIKTGVQVFFPNLLNVGGASRHESGDLTANRVRFSVPVLFPKQKKSA
jgi:hypothetical protein